MNMDNERLKILFVEDNAGDVGLVREMLKEAKGDTFDLLIARRLSDALEAAGNVRLDVILLDLTLPDSMGIETFDAVYGRYRSTPIIVLTGISDKNTAVKAAAKGAQDYLVKGAINADLLVRSIYYAIKRKQAEDRLSTINDCFLQFGADPLGNINRLVAVCGELLGGGTALYNRLEGEFLCSIGVWKTPKDYKTTDSAEGHICIDLIRGDEPGVVFIPDLPKTKYFKTDPNVRKYNLRSYMGTVVRFGKNPIGTLCVVYQHDIRCDYADEKVIEIIASAIGIEEERLHSEDSLRESQKRYYSIFDDSPMPLLEEDFSHVKERVDALKAQGVKNFREYFEKRPDVIPELVSLVKIIDVNNATVNLFGAQNKKDFRQGLNSIFVEETYAVARAEIVAISEGKTTFECETINQTFSGTPKRVYIKWTVIPGYEESYSKVLLSMVDMTAHRQAEAHARDSDERFQHLTDNLPNMVFIFYKGHIVYVNKKCVELSGYAAGEFYDDSFNYVKLLAPQSRQKAEQAFRQLMEGKQLKAAEYTLMAKDGRTMETLITGQGIDYNGGKAVLGIVTDVTEYNRIQRQVRAERDKAQLYLDLVGSIVVSLDAKGKVTLINKMGAEILGYRQDDILGKSWADHFVPASFRDEVKKYFKGLMSGKVEIFRYAKNPILTRGKEERIIAWNNIVLADDKGSPVGTLSAGTDITDNIKYEYERENLNRELAKSNRRLKQLVLRDPATGLYNHRFLINVLESEFLRAKTHAISFSIIMIDIDYFKSVNDLYGHDFGDMIIKQFVRQLKHMVRSYDILVRIGGEEFAVISPGSDKAMIMALAERIIESINLFNFGDKSREVKLTLSIGVVSFPEDKARNGMDLLNLAERIIDKAKVRGGNCVCISEDLERDSKKAVGRKKKGRELSFLRSRLDKLSKQSKQSIVESIFAFAKAIELRDHYTGEHVEQTVHYATEIAKAFGVKADEVSLIKQASMLHDLGKVGISDHILF
ncbi:MAG: diguanylate cyclase, partial [Candidatus Omnitrophica bacterium]|nr:diguanylate cyclase [Candidatus Omnitrophota bacterium]